MNRNLAWPAVEGLAYGGDHNPALLVSLFSGIAHQQDPVYQDGYMAALQADSTVVINHADTAAEVPLDGVGNNPSTEHSGSDETRSAKATL